MAQRAYRQRKESTLDQLRRRVTELSTAMECMNKTFEDCHNRLVSGGLHQIHLEELAEVSFSFGELMKVARNPSDSEHMLAPTKAPQGSTVPNVTGSTATDFRNVPGWIDHSTLDHASRDAHGPDVGLGYTMYMLDAPGLQQSAADFSAPAMAQALVPSAQVDARNRSREVGDIAFHSTIDIAPELPLPKTYNFQETTFGRMIHRACMESAYQLLVDPSKRPHSYERAFKLSLLSSSRQKLVAAMKNILDRGAYEDLGYAQAPSVHVGGAGTHYARRDAYGRLQLKKPTVHIGLVGPQMLGLLQGAAHDKDAAEMVVEIVGYEGEWLDPYDVEGYLLEKGIHIDPTASFAEAELTEHPAGSSNVSSGTSSTTGSGTPAALQHRFDENWPLDGWRDFQQANVDLTRWDDFDGAQIAGLGSGGFSDTNTESWLDFAGDAQLAKPSTSQSANYQADAYVLGTDLLHMPASKNAYTSVSSGKTARTRAVIIDVAKFIKGESMERTKDV